MRILRAILAVSEGLFRGLAEGLQQASDEIEADLGTGPDGDVQLWDLVREHEEMDRARIRHWRRQHGLHVAGGTTAGRRDGDSLIAQLAQSNRPTGGDAA